MPVPASFLTLLAEAVKPYDDQGRAHDPGTALARIDGAMRVLGL